MSGAIFFFSGTEAPKPPQHEKIRLMTLQPLDFKHEQIETKEDHYTAGTFKCLRTVIHLPLLEELKCSF